MDGQDAYYVMYFVLIRSDFRNTLISHFETPQQDVLKTSSHRDCSSLLTRNLFKLLHAVISLDYRCAYDIFCEYGNDISVSIIGEKVFD
jgi:hypothetical protein